MKATNVATGEVKFYESGAEAARGIGCKYAHAYTVLKKRGATVQGWALEYISQDDPQCATLRNEIERRIQAKRRDLVYKLLSVKRKMNDLKARRKSRHDEMMGLIDSAL